MILFFDQIHAVLAVEGFNKVPYTFLPNCRFPVKLILNHYQLNLCGSCNILVRVRNFSEESKSDKYCSVESHLQN